MTGIKRPRATRCPGHPGRQSGALRSLDIKRGGVWGKPAISREGGNPCQETLGKEKDLGKNVPGFRDSWWSGVDPGSKQDPRPSAWEVPEKGPRTLALLSRSPTKVESSRDGDRGERGRSSLARAGKGAAGGSSGRVTVYEVRMLRSGRWAMPPNRRG